jgi:hypothetical protein
MFEAAAGAFKPGSTPGAAAGATTAAEPTAAKSGEEIAALKAQLASLQDKIDKMVK